MGTRVHTRPKSAVIAVAVVALAVLVAALALASHADARRHHRPPAPRTAVLDRSAATVLRRGRVRVRVVGARRARARVVADFSVRVPRRAHRRARTVSVALTRTRIVRLGSHGRATVALALTVRGRRALRAALAGCRPLAVTVRVGGRRLGIRARGRLVAARGCGRRRLPGAPLTPGGGYPLRRTPGGPGAGQAPAVFRVGAAVSDFSPPLRGHVAGGDPADCDPTGQFDGSRTFAFVEPYKDLNGEGHYQGPTDAPSLVGVPPSLPSNPTTTSGDPYMDCNHNGRWEGNLIGGGGGDPRYYTKVADPVTARAIVVSNGSRTIAVEVVDQEGLFNVYQQEIRDRVAADGYKLDGIFISATHDESAPDTLGLGGVNSTTSGTNDYFLSYFIAQSAKAIEDAYKAMRPATVRYTETLEPSNVRQCWSSYPYVDDQHMPVLQAVGTDGKVIATLASVSQHTETLGFNGGTPALDEQNKWLTGDWPYFFRSALERRYGGVAIEMAGAVGSVESPEVYPSALSRTPQEFMDASHPAGCRTLFEVTHQPDAKDLAGKEHVALGYNGETQAFGEQMAAPIIRALDAGAYSTSISSDIWGERSTICVPVDNVLFTAAGAAGVFAHRPTYTSDCSAGAPVAPNGSTSGQSLESQVAAFRIGDGEFLSIPGEVFPFTFLRGFQGPGDMPTSGDALPPWLLPHMHTPFRFIDGLGEDMIGYIFPQGNAVGVPTQSNPNPSGDDRFGCHHSDDSEAASAKSADIVGNALVPLLDGHGGAAEATLTGRYVLADGQLSRDPLGGPELKCNTDNVFHPAGPAIGVELANGAVVHPAAWMSLSGLPQTTPDRDTRGYFDGAGRRVWLDVFPDLQQP